MANTAVRRGIDGKLYVNTGSYGTPSWTEVSNVRDLVFPMTKDATDSSVRGSSGTATDEPTLKRIEASWQMNQDTADSAGWDEFSDAFHADEILEILILDRTTGSGAQGVRMHVKVHTFSHSQLNTGIQITDVMVRPCVNTNAAPAWYTGS